MHGRLCRSVAIHLFDMDILTAKMYVLQKVQTMSNPTGIAIPRGFRWYANLVGHDVAPAMVSAYEIHWPPRYVQDPNGPETHFFWVLDYFYTPGATIRVGKGGAWVPRPPFVAWLYRPNSIYWHAMKSRREPSRSIYISLRGGEAVNLSRYLPGSSDACCFADPDHVLGSKLEEMVTLGETARTEGFLDAQILLFQILTILNSSRKQGAGHHIIHRPSSTSPHSTQLVSITRSYMERHLAERITLTQLARQANLSVSAFSQQFKAQTSESPMHLLARLRIHRAKELLLRGEALRNIAEATGFCDAYHLSRRFKQIEKMPPRTFLKRLDAVFSPDPGDPRG